MQLSSEDDDAFNRAIGHIFHQTKSFKIKCAEDTYNDEKRVKYTIQSCDPVDWASECTVRSHLRSFAAHAQAWWSCSALQVHGSRAEAW